MKIRNALIVLMMFFFAKGQAQWAIVDSLSMGTFKSVHFINSDTGFAFDEYGNGLRRTLDGGSTWTAVATPSFVYNIYDYDFVDSKIGYAVGASFFPSFGAYTNCIIKTMDGGQTWDSILGNYDSGELTTVDVLSASEFYAGRTGFVLHSTNSGATYDTIDLVNGSSIEYLKVKFTSPSTGYMLINDFQGFYWSVSYLYKTSDSGNTWQNIFSDTVRNGYLYWDMEVISTGEIFLGGDKGVLMYSPNEGGTWVKHHLADTSLALVKLRYSAGKLYAIGEHQYPPTSKIYMSPDSGLTWKVEIVPSTTYKYFVDFSFPTARVGYVVSGNQLYKNIDHINLEEYPLARFRLYPNPVAQSVSVELLKEGPCQLYIYNGLGQRVFAFSCGRCSKFDLDLSSLKTGLYMMEVEQNGVRYAKRLMKG